MTDDAFHLTALDARRYDFGNALRGYDRARVDQFREQVAEELERLSRANAELNEKAKSFHEQLRAFRERDKALNDALISAQQLRGEIREQAQREAQLIIREAQGEAERSLDALRAEIRRAEDELHELWRNRRSYLAQLRSLMERQLSHLDNSESVPPPSVIAHRLESQPVAPRREPAREPVREPVREAPREQPVESSRDVVRDAAILPPRGPAAESFRDIAGDAAPEPVEERPFTYPPLRPVESGRDGLPRDVYPDGSNLRETQSIEAIPRDAPPVRPTFPTPSWLDVVEGE